MCCRLAQIVANSAQRQLGAIDGPIIRKHRHLGDEQIVATNAPSCAAKLPTAGFLEVFVAEGERANGKTVTLNFEACIRYGCEQLLSRRQSWEEALRWP